MQTREFARALAIHKAHQGAGSGKLRCEGGQMENGNKLGGRDFWVAFRVGFPFHLRIRIVPFSHISPQHHRKMQSEADEKSFIFIFHCNETVEPAGECKNVYECVCLRWSKYPFGNSTTDGRLCSDMTNDWREFRKPRALELKRKDLLECCNSRVLKGVVHLKVSNILYFCMLKS